MEEREVEALEFGSAELNGPGKRNPPLHFAVEEDRRRQPNLNPGNKLAERINTNVVRKKPAREEAGSFRVLVRTAPKGRSRKLKKGSGGTAIERSAQPGIYRRDRTRREKRGYKGIIFHLPKVTDGYPDRVPRPEKKTKGEVGGNTHRSTLGHRKVQKGLGEKGGDTAMNSQTRGFE